MSLAPLTSPALDHSRIAHAFFTREGGVSTGIHTSLNGGTGSKDDQANVVENRRRMAEHLGVAPDRLVLPFLCHSPDAVVVSEPFADDARPRCDGLATRVPGLALGVTGADCGTVLLADPEAGVVGACHAGWRGALNGVLEATLVAMESLGARRAATSAVLGPTIARGSYEVGPEFAERLISRDATYGVFLAPAARVGHWLFDLPGFIGHRLVSAGVGSFVDLAEDTYADEARFFSYRRSTHRGEPDYGRLVSAITLKG